MKIDLNILKSKMKSTMTSASGPLVIQAFLPLRTHLSPFFVAVVCKEITSEPASGSLIAIAPIYSPLQSLGRNFFF